MLALGTVACGLINFGSFRRRFLGALNLFGRILRRLLFDLPAWLVRLRIIRAAAR